MALTPMMVQYLELKEKYKDSILLFRLGDFYEMFFDDAILCSKELELTLTGKDCGLEERAPMCGIPYHAVNTYIPKLIEKGYKVAIGEQIEDPKDAVGIVKRDVVKIITPGTITELTMLEEKKNNYIMAIVKNKQNYGVAYSDISTGEFNTSKISSINSINVLIDEIAKIMPSEIILDNQLYQSNDFKKEIEKRFSLYISTYNENINTANEEDEFKKFNSKLQNISQEEKKEATTLLLKYIIQTQKNSVAQIVEIKEYEVLKYMQLDISTRKNLEIFETSKDKNKKGSLLWVVDKTSTAMGGRLLRKWLEAPLVIEDEIVLRQNTVETLLNNLIDRTSITEALKKIYDIERIISKVVSSNINGRDLISLKNSINQIPNLKKCIKELVQKSNDKYLNILYNNLDELTDVAQIIENSIVEDPPIVLKEGNLIKYGYDKIIDEYKEALTNGKTWIMNLEQEERDKTGIKTLKVGFNRVFGYYIEITNSYKSQVPENRYIRKQTLAGSERYITPELKEIEEKLLGAEEKLIKLEYDIFCKIREIVANEVIRIKKTAEIIATIDVVVTFAKVAEENRYVKPEIIKTGEIIIEEGRHPVVEHALKGTEFIPNDTYINNDLDRFIVITGPNMAGKSTYMRQIALITYMAQVGLFVPAKKAKLSIVDKIFTRVGASDDLAMGQSTFMVEMAELANIMKNATKNSLVILDEIGRGTSTYDGLAIAWATVEYMVDKEKIGAKTLFATHYHELIELEEKIEGVKNYSVEVKEKGDEVIFLRKIAKGGTDDSYGIYVAKLAGVPQEVVIRAKEILKNLENVALAKKSIDSQKKVSKEQIQVDLFNYKLAEISKILEKINLDELSAKEALDILYKLKDKLD